MALQLENQGYDGERTREQATRASKNRFYSVADFIADLMAGKFASKPAPLALGTPVHVTTLGVDGVISGFNPNESNRVRVSWFNRHFWRVDHKWLDREVVEPLKQTAAPR